MFLLAVFAADVVGASVVFVFFLVMWGQGTVVSIQVRISRYTLPSASPMQTGSLLGQLSRCCRRFAFSFEKSEQVDFGRFPQIVLVYDMRADVTCVRCYLFPLFIIPQPLKLHSAPDIILVLSRI